MINNYSEARQRAESAFDRIQTEHLRRSRIISEQESLHHAQDAKSTRLRQLRLERDANNLVTAKVKMSSVK